MLMGVMEMGGDGSADAQAARRETGVGRRRWRPALAPPRLRAARRCASLCHCHCQAPSNAPHASGSKAKNGGCGTWHEALPHGCSSVQWHHLLVCY